MSSLVSSVLYTAHTAFLFTKSDIKSTVIPLSICAAAAAPIVELSRVPHVLFWIWFHMLQFCVSNQTLDPEEDGRNKRDRPLPSGRITLRNAIILRWVLVPACWALSACYSLQTVYASIVLVALTVIYDELHAHAGNWLVRNTVNALGFASFEVGATFVAVSGPIPHALDGTGILALCISAGIFVTTIHTQDFKDTDGDRAIGRQTIPIVYPGLARWTVIVPLLLWSISLALVWKLDSVTATAYITLGLFVGGRFLTLKSLAEHRVSFYWYNVWLAAAHAFPGYYRAWGHI
ncbi:UbiA prenyltransferase family [Amylostereum chailletii]|nr:UbiA prenyltransferase family [Amylostereum chailletii]